MSPLILIRNQLLESIDRWSPEVVSSPARSTLRSGIAQKCYSLIDKMLEICVDEAVRECGFEGLEAVRACSGGKPKSRLTLGERSQILEKLDSRLSQVLGSGLPTNNSRIIGRNGVELLHRLSRNRNRFAHDRAEIDPAEVAELLTRATEFCESKLVSTIVEVQRRGAGV